MVKGRGYKTLGKGRNRVVLRPQKITPKITKVEKIQYEPPKEEIVKVEEHGDKMV